MRKRIWESESEESNWVWGSDEEEWDLEEDKAEKVEERRVKSVIS